MAGGAEMKGQDVLTLLVLGALIWIAGTIHYARTGAAVLETTPLRFWSGFVASPLISAALCLLILRWRHIPAAKWSSAILLLAIPGMIGEAIVLLNLSVFMPKIHQTSGGKYGAFLFATYALVLGMAEIVTLMANP
jgi:hypothetical protein